MENTGNGGVAATETGNPGMAGSSTRSPRNAKSNTRSTAPVSQELALEMLASAVNYLRAAGMIVVIGNATIGTTLVVGVRGAEVKDNAFVLTNHEVIE